MNNYRLIYEDACTKPTVNRLLLSREILSAIEYIEANYAQPLSLNKIAKQVYLSPAYFSKQFKIQTGMFFTSFVNAIRLHYAEIFIRESDIPTYIIGRKVGFKNKGYFLLLFKEQYGRTPVQYRKMHRNNAAELLQYPDIPQMRT